MATTYEKTLTVKGIEKAVDRFSNSLSYSKYRLDGAEKELEFLKTVKDEDSVKIYLYFDDGVTGNISNIRVLDKDEDTVIEIEDSFTKESDKGFYILFKYKFVEEVNNEL